MADLKFITEVHVAAEPEQFVQRCARCSCILIDARNVSVMVPTSQSDRGIACWGPGEFIGVIHGNPTQSFVMDHDATEADEIACNRQVQ